MLPGLHVFAGGDYPITVTAGTLADSGSSALTTYNFASVGFNSLGQRRVIIVCGAAHAGTAGRTLSSATIGGVSASILQQHTQGSGVSGVAFIIAAFVPTGTSGTVSVTFSGAMGGCVIRPDTLYNVRSLTPTFNDSAGTNAATSVTVASATAVQGGIIYGSGEHEFSGVGSGWTGLTELEDQAYGNALNRFSCARELAAGFSSPSSVQFSHGVSSGRTELVVVSLR